MLSGELICSGCHRRQIHLSGKEVACPCCVSVPVGPIRPILPGCVRVTSVVEETIDQGVGGEVRLESGQK